MNRRIALAVLLVAHLLVLGCNVQTALPISRAPRWACPSPTALPTRLKEQIPLPTTTPGVDPTFEDVYTEPYEAEYGLPARTPTPYEASGLSYYLGQRVEIAPLHVEVTAAGGPVTGTEQLHQITIRWHNPSTDAILMDYPSRVHIRAIRTDGDVIQGSDTWAVSQAALDRAGITLPDIVPPGESSVTLPILAPAGTVEVVEVAFLPHVGGAIPSGGPTPTPTANADLRADDGALVRVQWRAGDPQPPCPDAGALTDWGAGPAPLPNVPAPPGTARVVQIALQQVGKPYIWGAKGPQAFDCSGLTEWSYAQVGIDIPTGTSGQWPLFPPVADGALQSGDLLFFDTATGQRTTITHVGLVTDVNADGHWDMVHAASPEYGVRVDYNVFERPYYRNMYMGARTVRSQS